MHAILRLGSVGLDPVLGKDPSIGFSVHQGQDRRNQLVVSLSLQGAPHLVIATGLYKWLMQGTRKTALLDREAGRTLLCFSWSLVGRHGVSSVDDMKWAHTTESQAHFREDTIGRGRLSVLESPRRRV
jgi:hypothetical protein